MRVLRKLLFRIFVLTLLGGLVWSVARIWVQPPGHDDEAARELEEVAKKRSWVLDPPPDIPLYDGPENVMLRHAFNEQRSNALASNRDIPDTRDQTCKALHYDISELPAMSVIICFHNEARSTLLRTVRTVVERTPPSLLREIILVDDFSDWPVDQHLAEMQKVRVVRTERREGLIRARVRGAVEAKAEVVTFLDSHCEANVGWAEPLLQRVKEDPKHVVTPIIDVIDDNTFNYVGSPLVRGGFNWGLTFKWKSIPRGDRKSTDPILSPTMAGGLFTMNREYFFSLGSYDLAMDVWGGENLEMSFRIWQCGGTLEIMPCSRVGHVFRKRHPYSFPGGGVGNIFLKNSMRVAEVWMDEFKANFYATRGGKPKDLDIGDLSERIELRQKLGCKSFRWYLEQINPELRVPDLHGRAWGDVRSANFCLDSLGNQNGGALGMYACHGQGGNQGWVLGKTNELRHDELCVDVAGQGREARMRGCPDESIPASMTWERTPAGQLRNPSSQLCLDRAGGSNGAFIKTSPCSSSPTQIWAFAHTTNA